MVQEPTVARVGRVTVVYWSGGRDLALALARVADRAGPWPGLAQSPAQPLRLVLAADAARFDSLTGGRLPEWGVGAALPAAGTVVLRATARDPARVVRHELAHLALHRAVAGVPRWFDEGYAARAAGEWDRLTALRVNWALVRGAVPSLDELDGYLRADGPARAEAAYALAATAVLLLERLGGTRGLAPLLDAWRETGEFDRALRISYQLTLGQFQERWQRDLRRRYGWLLALTSFTMFWAVAAVLLAALWWWRRRRDRARRAALEEEESAVNGAGWW